MKTLETSKPKLKQHYIIYSVDQIKKQQMMEELRNSIEATSDEEMQSYREETALWL